LLISPDRLPFVKEEIWPQSTMSAEKVCRTKSLGNREWKEKDSKQELGVGEA
jgi:hypothetical protein